MPMLFALCLANLFKQSRGNFNHLVVDDAILRNWLANGLRDFLHIEPSLGSTGQSPSRSAC